MTGTAGEGTSGIGSELTHIASSYLEQQTTLMKHRFRWAFRAPCLSEVLPAGCWRGSQSCCSQRPCADRCYLPWAGVHDGKRNLPGSPGRGPRNQTTRDSTAHPGGALTPTHTSSQHPLSFSPLLCSHHPPYPHQTPGVGTQAQVSGRGGGWKDGQTDVESRDGASGWSRR